jgi:hypothetical protein
LAAPGLYHPSTRRKLPLQLLCETLAEAISQALLNTGELRPQPPPDDAGDP